MYDIKVTPRSEREVLISKRVEASQETGEPLYEFRGDKLTPTVIALEIDALIYRLENCRTFSAQQTEIAKQGLEKEHFSKGQERSSVQRDQHDILVALAKRGTKSVTPIIDVLKKDGQREPILITSSGVVVNGNRRLAAMRELYKSSNGSVDSRFSHVRCAVLPEDTTPDEIDDIEADLQARPQTKLDYDWIGDAQLIRRQVNKRRSTKEVADRLRRSEAEIKNTLLALEEADLYLNEWANKPGQYDLVSADGEQIFSDIPKGIANKGNELQDASRVIAWSLYENRDKLPRRVYSFNAAFGKLAPQVLEALEDQLDLEAITLDEDDGADDFSIDIDPDGSDSSFTLIKEALRQDETKDEAATILIEACETAIEKDKGLKNEQAALKALSQVNSKLMGIDVNSAGEKTLPAMAKQVESIGNALSAVKERIDKRIKGIEASKAAK